MSSWVQRAGFEWRKQMFFGFDDTRQSNILELLRVAYKRQWRGALCLPLRVHPISCAGLKCNFRQSFSPLAFDCNPVWRFGLARCISLTLLFDGNLAAASSSNPSGAGLTCLASTLAYVPRYLERQCIK